MTKEKILNGLYHKHSERIPSYDEHYPVDVFSLMEDVWNAALASQAQAPAPEAAQAVPAGLREVAKVQSWTNGSYWRNYKLAWFDGTDDLEAGTVLYTLAAPALAAASTEKQGNI